MPKVIFIDPEGYTPPMPNIDKHAPGAFCWIELATTDQKAAKDFYGSLFGWGVSDMPMGPGDFYTMFKLDGRDTGAAYTLRPDQRAQGVPPHWMIYIAVESADQTAARAAELGAKVFAPPFDVYDAGRMAVLQDPSGAVFSIWQAKKNTGIGIAGVPGTLCWADLSTPDTASATRFYSGLFGWKLTAGEKDTSGYLHIQNGETFIGGVPPAAHRDPSAPPHWLAYFYVADCDAVVNKAKSLGAAVYLEPMSMENVGRFSVLADPQGAVFAVFQETKRA
jgi:predicted enzyme related to lactoylglutathione lyase